MVKLKFEDDVNTNKNILDSRTIEDFIDELESEIDLIDSKSEDIETELASTKSESVKEHLEEKLQELKDEKEDYSSQLKPWIDLRDQVDEGTWFSGITFIRDSYMERYARDYAEDIHGDSLYSATWPFTCINWKQATEEFKMDFSAIEIDGITYWFRE